jgi:hypothetical protein
MKPAHPFETPTTVGPLPPTSGTTRDKVRSPNIRPDYKRDLRTPTIVTSNCWRHLCLGTPGSELLMYAGLFGPCSTIGQSSQWRHTLLDQRPDLCVEFITVSQPAGGCDTENSGTKWTEIFKQFSSSPGTRRDSYRHQYNGQRDQYGAGTELRKIRTSYLSHF